MLALRMGSDCWLIIEARTLSRCVQPVCGLGMLSHFRQSGWLILGHIVLIFGEYTAVVLHIVNTVGIWVHAHRCLQAKSSTIKRFAFSPAW